MHGRYRNLLDALLAVGVAGVSAALALPAKAKPTDLDVALSPPMPVAQRLQEIRDAVSAFDPTVVPQDGVHGSVADPDIKLAWWANGNGRGWGNGRRVWGNGPGLRWPNGGWHNWGNGGRVWINF
jgi:rSAM-associated Gly-rich repeat protein